MTNSPFAAHSFGGPSPLQSVSWSRRQTSSDSEGLWGGRARLAGIGPAPGLWSVQHCVHWHPEARTPSATSRPHLCHLPAELGPRPAFQQTAVNSNSGKLGCRPRL